MNGLSHNLGEIRNARGDVLGVTFPVEHKGVFWFTCYHFHNSSRVAYVYFNGRRYIANLIRAYSNPRKNIMVLSIKDTPSKPFQLAETLEYIPKDIRGIIEPISCVVLTNTTRIDINLNLEYKTSKILLDVDGGGNLSVTKTMSGYSILGRFFPKSSGSPVCNRIDGRVLGMFVYCNSKEGLVVPVHTLLKRFEPRAIPHSAAVLSPSDRLIENANRKLSDRKYTEAINLFKEITEKIKQKDPNYTIALNNLGSLYSKVGNIESAIKCFEKALKLEPYYTSLWINKGQLHLDLEEYDQAIECFRKALEILPYDTDTWSALAKSYYENGQYNESIACYKKATILEPENQRIWHDFGLLYMNIGNFSKAIHCFDKVLNMSPKNLDSLIVKGVALKMLGRFNESLAVYREVTKVDPKRPEAWTNKGIVLSELGKYLQALKCYEKALDVDPNFPPAWHAKAIDLKKLGLIAESEICWKRATDLLSQAKPNGF